MPLHQNGLERLAEVFDELGIVYLVGGSVASSAHGVARSTMDTDILADLRADKIDQFAFRSDRRSGSSNCSIVRCGIELVTTSPIRVIRY